MLPILLLAFQLSASPPVIAGAIAADSKSIAFSCATGASCPVQFGTAVVSDGTPQCPVTIVRLPTSSPEYVVFVLGYQTGLRVGSNATVGCGTPASCIQD